MVIVSWVPANDYTISHRLEAGSAPGLTDIATLDVPITQSTYFLTDVPAATYHVRIRAVRGSLVSGPSNEIIVTVAGCPGPPAPPTLRAEVYGQDVWLYWGLGANAGCPTDGFQIEAGHSPGAADVGVFDIQDFHITQRTFFAVPVGAYYVRARYRRDGVVGEASSDVLVPVACTPPPQIANPHARVVGNAAQFTWQYSPFVNSTFTVFLEAGSAPGLADLGVIAARKDANTGFNAAGMAGTYFTRLRATNDCGSTVSSELSVTLTSACPVPDTVSFLDAGLSNGTPSLSVWWQPPVSGGLVMDYEVRVGSSPGDDDLGRRFVDGRTTPPSFGPYGYFEAFAGISQARAYVQVTPSNTCGSGARLNAYANSGVCPNAPPPTTIGAQVNGRRATISWPGTFELEPAYLSVVEIGTSPSAADVHRSPLLYPTYLTSNLYSIDLLPGRYFVRVKRANHGCTEPGNASPEVSFVIEQ